MSLRIIFYSHDGFGLGHVSRNIKLAKGLLARRPSADVLIITGAVGLQELPLPANTDYVKLPSVKKQATGRWRPQSLDIEMEHLLALRRTMILEAVRAYRPHLFVADFLPLGVEGELIPALEELRGRQDTHAAIGFRDVLDEPAVIKETWESEGTIEALERLYDLVLIYGEPEWFDFSAYGLSPDRLRYVGLLGDPDAAARVRLTDEIRLLATCGGGSDGETVIAAALEAVQPLQESLKNTVKLTALTGPLMAEPAMERLREIGKRVGAPVRRFEEDIGRKLSRSRAVVGMGGCNTVYDVLSYRRPAVIVPRPGPSREQLIRARILAQRGLATVVPLAQCTGQALAQALVALIEDDGYPEERLPELGGIDNAVEALLDLVA